MKRIQLCLLLLWVAVAAHAQLLWKISGNGLEKPSYLFGTHHFAPVEFVDSVPGLTAALQSADNLCGEIVLDEMQSPATVQALQQAVALPADTTLQLLFIPEHYTEISAKIKELMGVDAAQLNGIKPAFIVNQLNLLFALKSVPNFNPQQQIDGWLQTIARQLNKEVTAFETPSFQLALLFNSQPLTRQAQLLLYALRTPDAVERQIAELTSPYMAQNLAQLETIATAKHHTPLDPLPAEEAALITDRNHRWATLMPEIMSRRSTLFAVGAAHLVGKEGLINLLKTNGYTLEAVK